MQLYLDRKPSIHQKLKTLHVPCPAIIIQLQCLSRFFYNTIDVCDDKSKNAISFMALTNIVSDCAMFLSSPLMYLSVYAMIVVEYLIPPLVIF